MEDVERGFGGGGRGGRGSAGDGEERWLSRRQRAKSPWTPPMSVIDLPLTVFILYLICHIYSPLTFYPCC